MSVESQKSITEWADLTFGMPTSRARVAARALEEMAELLREITSDADTNQIAMEIADIFIVLYRLASMCGVDIHQKIDEKMLINHRRVWGLDATGHGYHIRKKEPDNAVIPAP